LPKILKILAIAFGLAALLLVIAIIVLPILVDPNQHKGEIIRLVKEHTGRDLKIDGEISLSVFPSIGLETGRMELSNAAGFGKQAFARVNGTAIHVALLPLLRKQITVQGLRLDELELNLLKRRDGRSNWDDLAQSSQSPKPATKAPAAVPAAAVAVPAFYVDKISVRKANLTWRDERAGSEYALRNLDLTAENLAPGEFMNLKIGFDLEVGNPKLRERVIFETRAQLDIDRQTVEVPALTLALGGFQLSAQLQGRKILDAPALNGTVEIKSFNARELLAKLAAAPDTADKAALTKLALRSDFDATAKSVAFKNMNVTLDDSRLSGALSVKDFDRPAHQFNLVLDQFDLDRYLPAPAPPGKSVPSGTPAAPQPVAIPLGALRELNANGELRIGSLKATGIRSSDVSIKIAARGGLITLGPNRAKLYDGAYAGQTVIDARGKLPAYQFNEQLTGIQIGPFLKDIEVFDRYSGTGTVALKLSAHGLDAESVTRSLNGNASVVLRDGKVRGVNLEKTIKTARALSDQARNKEISVNPDAGDETAFKSLSATFILTNGAVRNGDLLLEGPVVRANGKGDADLVKDRIDYRLNVTLAEDAAREGTTVPLKIHGKLSKPSFTIDFGALAKQQVEKKIQQEKGKAKEELRDRLKKKLFGR
jgi:AsmA protein